MRKIVRKIRSDLDLTSVQFSHRYHSMRDVQSIAQSCYIVFHQMEKIQQTKAHILHRNEFPFIFYIPPLLSVL